MMPKATPDRKNLAPRPLSVTIISWLLIALGTISLLASFGTLNNPDTAEVLKKNLLPPGLQITIFYLGLAVTFLAGIFMLQRANWARWLYVGWCGLSLAIGLFTSPAKIMLIPGLLLGAINTFFLFRPRANAYFANITTRRSRRHRHSHPANAGENPTS